MKHRSSRERRIRRISCRSKVKYVDESAARSHALGEVRHAYKCKFCDGWHLSRQYRPDEAGNWIKGN